MVNRFYPHSLYNFLRIASSYSLRNRILDCGAGGPDPKIAFFQEYGYELYGIDIDDEEIKDANEFAKNNGIALNITKADMREIPFEDGFFGLVFSYLSMVHLSKGDTGIAIKEIHRVLQKGGLCCLNFLSIDDQWYDEEKAGLAGEIRSIHNGIEEIHSYFEDKEPDKYFKDFKIIYSAKIQHFTGNYHTTGRTCILDYIAKKL